MRVIKCERTTQIDRGTDIHADSVTSGISRAAVCGSSALAAPSSLAMEFRAVAQFRRDRPRYVV
jgi:hypothetical protein